MDYLTLFSNNMLTYTHSTSNLKYNTNHNIGNDYSLIYKEIITDCPISNETITFIVPIFYETFVGIIDTHNIKNVTLTIKNNVNEYTLELYNDTNDGIWKISNYPLPLYNNNTNLTINITINYLNKNKHYNEIFSTNVILAYGLFPDEHKNIIITTPIYKIPIKVEKYSQIKLICGYVSL